MLWPIPVACFAAADTQDDPPADTVSCVEQLSPSQRHLRSQVETGIAIASPFLDAILAIGERISRFAEPRDYEYYPVRDEGEPEAEWTAPQPNGTRP